MFFVLARYLQNLLPLQVQLDVFFYDKGEHISNLAQGMGDRYGLFLCQFICKMQNVLLIEGSLEKSILI